MDLCEDDETEKLLLGQMVQLEQQAMDAAVPHRRATVGCPGAESENRKDTVATGHRQVMALACDFACAIQPGCFLSRPARPRSPMLANFA